jgi:hypothetical protein
MKITLTKAQARALHFEEYDEEFEFIEMEDWEDDGKYSNTSIIFRKDGKFYSLEVSRCGSYFTDYEYDYILNCHEVEKVIVQREEWIYKKDASASGV